MSGWTIIAIILAIGAVYLWAVVGWIRTMDKLNRIIGGKP